jgi:hypothetical protein
MYNTGARLRTRVEREALAAGLTDLKAEPVTPSSKTIEELRPVVADFTKRSVNLTLSASLTRQQGAFKCIDTFATFRA